jgi:hypothetical protein
MAKPNIQIDNEVREMTDKEFESYQAEKAQAQAQEQERQSKIAARESALAKLAKLGLTQAEIDAL